VSPPVFRPAAAQAALPLQPPGFDPSPSWSEGHEVRLPSPFAFGETVARMVRYESGLQTWDLTFGGARYATVRADFQPGGAPRVEVLPEGGEDVPL